MNSEMAPASYAHGDRTFLLWELAHQPLLQACNLRYETDDCLAMSTRRECIPMLADSSMLHGAIMLYSGVQTQMSLSCSEYRM